MGLRACRARRHVSARAEQQQCTVQVARTGDAAHVDADDGSASEFLLGDWDSDDGQQSGVRRPKRGHGGPR